MNLRLLAKIISTYDFVRTERGMDLNIQLYEYQLCRLLHTRLHRFL